MTTFDSGVLQALVDRAVLKEPLVLYKYRGASSQDDIAKLRDILIRNRIWLATPLSFNDPFDCFPAPVITGRPDQRRRALSASFYESGLGSGRKERRKRAKEVSAMKDTDELTDLLEAGLQQTLSKTCALSMSEKWDSLLMWSHYAQAHAGVCIELNRWEPESIITTSLPVHYDQERPVVDVLFDTGDAKVVKALYTKSSVWEYEAEWRAVMHEPEGLKTLPQGVVSRVILGAAMNPLYRAEVLKLCAEAGIGCAQATFHRRRWELELQDPGLHGF